MRCCHPFMSVLQCAGQLQVILRTYSDISFKILEQTVMDRVIQRRIEITGDHIHVTAQSVIKGHPILCHSSIGDYLKHKHITYALVTYGYVCRQCALATISCTHGGTILYRQYTLSASGFHAVINEYYIEIPPALLPDPA